MITEQLATARREASLAERQAVVAYLRLPHADLWTTLLRRTAADLLAAEAPEVGDVDPLLIEMVAAWAESVPSIPLSPVSYWLRVSTSDAASRHDSAQARLFHAVAAEVDEALGRAYLQPALEG